MSDEAVKLADILSMLSILSSLFVGIAVIVATYRGPIRASCDADERRANSEVTSRKLNVFRMLMGHRYDLFNPAFVQGLNLVQIEFRDSPLVLQEYKKFLNEFRDRSHESNQSVVVKERADAITRLIVSIGTDLGYNLDPLSLLDECYAPLLWRTESDKQSAVKDMLHEIAIGNKALPVLNIIPEHFISKDEDGMWSIRVKFDNS